MKRFGFVWFFYIKTLTCSSAIGAGKSKTVQLNPAHHTKKRTYKIMQIVVSDAEPSQDETVPGSGRAVAGSRLTIR